MENYQEKLKLYEDLLMTYESLKKKAENIWLEYMLTFGDLIEKNYLASIECVRLKKMISYCQTMKNAGREIVKEQMESFVEIELADYYDELEMIVYAKQSRGTPISPSTYEKIKSTYRKIALMIHPDINGEIFSEEIASLWEKAKLAYRANDYDELIALSVLISKAVQENGGKNEEVVLEDIDERILLTRDLISEIVYSEPYIFKAILEDKEKIKAKERMILDEIEQCENYAKQLGEKLSTYQVEEVCYE